MTTWSFGGTTLTTFGKITILNDYLDMPARRGDNQLIPYHHGTVFVPKYYDSRSIMMGIAINAASSTALESTFDSMRALFSPNTQATLAATLDSGQVRNALACVETPLRVERKSATVALAVMEFSMAFPFFRAGTAIADNTTVISTTPVAMNVVNTGDVEERDPTVTLIGPLNNVTILNTTNNYSLSYDGTISGTVIIQTVSGEYQALNGTVNVIGNVAHSGGAALMALNVGTNVMSISNSGGTTGSVKIGFFAPYL